MKRLILILILLTPTITIAQNYPCSRGKGGINHCEGSLFVCNDGSYSASKKDCSSYFVGNKSTTKTIKKSSKNQNTTKNKTHTSN